MISLAREAAAGVRSNPGEHPAWPGRRLSEDGVAVAIQQRRAR